MTDTAQALALADGDHSKLGWGNCIRSLVADIKERDRQAAEAAGYLELLDKDNDKLRERCSELTGISDEQDRQLKYLRERCNELRSALQALADILDIFGKKPPTSARDAHKELDLIRAAGKKARDVLSIT